MHLKVGGCNMANWMVVDTEVDIDSILSKIDTDKGYPLSPIEGRAVTQRWAIKHQRITDSKWVAPMPASMPASVTESYIEEARDRLWWPAEEE